LGVGLILDNIIVFLFWTFARQIQEFCAERWPIATGVVEESDSPKTVAYPYAKILYDYSVKGERHTGKYRKAFWLRSSAEEYAAKFALKSEIVVRYRASHPSVSVLRYRDQSKTN
jgi:hypothetical protein